MKKILLPLLGLVILFAACNYEECNHDNPNVKTLSNLHFYGIKTVEHPRGVAQIKKLWYPGTTIDIRFLNGSESFHQKVKTYAAEWEQYADITFNFIEQGNADVRISFDSNESRYITWSTIGTDCKMIPNQEPTMNFVDWDYLYEDEIKGDVLRAFGQVLGLELEHRHIDFDAGWRDNISLYWKGSIEDIPWEELKKYVFDPLEASKVLQTDGYDEESIMIWPFPRQFALNTARDYNYELSEKDKEFISSVYPKSTVGPDPAIIITTSGQWTHFLNLETSESDLGLLIDWGNGITQIIYNDLSFYLDQPAGASNTLKIYGGEQSFINIGLPAPNVIDVQLKKCIELRSLDISHSYELKAIDLSGNIKLEELDFSNTMQLEYLDVSGNVNLKKVRYLNYVSESRLDLVGFIQSLPDRSGKDTGELIVSVNEIEPIENEIIPILENKNWILIY